MKKQRAGRIIAILFFLSLLSGALFYVWRVTDDIHDGEYFAQPEEMRYDIIYLTSLLLIILFVLRYGYFLAVNKVTWADLKDDYIFLLTKKYFSRTQWIINILLFWLSLSGFIYSLAITAMKGNL